MSNEENNYVYNISVELSESEAKSFFAKAGELNSEPGELIKSFIRDTSSMNLNSQDRGARAIGRWYDEMYSFTRTDTLLSYLFRNNCYETFIEDYDFLLDLKAEIIENPDSLQDPEFMIAYKDSVENYSVYIKDFEHEMISGIHGTPIEITAELKNIRNWRDMNMQSLSKVIKEKENNIEKSLSYKAGYALALINLKDIKEQTKYAFERDKLKAENTSDLTNYAKQGLEYLDKLISSFSIDRDIMKMNYNQKMKLVIVKPTDAVEGYKSLVDKVIHQHKEFRKQNSVKMKDLNMRIEADSSLLSSPKVQKELDVHLTHDSNQILFTSRLLNVLQSDYSRFCESVGETVAAKSMENQDEEEMYPDL